MGGLRFHSPSSERAFLQARLQERSWHITSRVAGCVKWVAWLAAVGPEARCLALAAFLLSLLALLLVWKPPYLHHRLHFVIELVIDTLQPLCACALFHHHYPAAAATGAGALRAVACVLAGNGVLALVCRAKASPLPFRWQLPVVLATATALLAHTHTFCSSALLQHGFRTLHTLLHILLPLVAPAFLHLMPREGFAALLAPVPDADAEGAALCAAYQAPSVVLGCAALAYHLYAAEVRQRKAFLARNPAARARMAPTAF